MTVAAPRLPEAWRIDLPVFEGPLDLLLELVRLNRVEVTDIPVALICDQFHDYLHLLEELDLDVAAEYIYEAALLIHLKSKLLLPRPADGREGEEDDPRRELVERLLEYQRLKEASQSLAEIDRLRSGIWTRPREPLPRGEAGEDEELELEEISLFDLLRAFRGVLDRFDREHPAALHLRAESFSVRAQLDRLLDRLDSARPLDLFEHLRALSCRAEAVAAFLAVLELLRMRLVRLHGGAGSPLLHRTRRQADAAELEGIRS